MSPFGPFLATVKEISRSDQVGMWLTVNGVYRQKSTTAQMIFDVPTLVCYMSQFRLF
jgi:2-keto-4-pentenoate hydratase/2-oxohepta-3-ene-1,7-dioic acid hydratase in catechol pathway